MRRILIVEDERSIQKLIKINLERENFIVLEASSGEEALAISNSQDIDLIILDLMLPGIDGYEVCKRIRERKSNVGIIMLTAKSQNQDKIFGLEKGADDYMTKPFVPQELVLRVKSLLRRIPKKTSSSDYSFGPFKIREYSKSFLKKGMEIKLTPIEFQLVNLFIKNPGKAYSRNDLLDKIWGYNYMGDTKIVDVNIRRLRAKIEDNPSEPKYIETIWGLGYRWKREE